MATLDIRMIEEDITRIQWGGCDFVQVEGRKYLILNNYSSVIVYKHEIDNLIKALQKAKELWHNKM